MRDVLSRLNVAFSSAALFPGPPPFRFRAEFTHCPHCGAKPKVLKTHKRHPVTLHLGPFIAQETMLCCDQCPDRPVFHSEELAALVAPNRTFGYDVMVHCGEAMLRRCCDADTVVADLAGRNVTISASEVRELAARFVVSLGIAQAEASPRLREELHAAGGYVLHLDCTGKGGSPRLLTGIDEITGLVLLNAKIVSESQDDIGEFLDSIRERFGEPIAVSCDMARGNLAALAARLPAVPVFVCHFHFLRDLGKDLMGRDYATLRARLRHHGPKAELRRLQGQLRELMQAHQKQLAALLLAVDEPDAVPRSAPSVPNLVVLGSFVASILEAERQADGYGFPFDQTHLLFFRRAQCVLTAAQALCSPLLLDARERKLFARLIKLLKPLCSDQEALSAADAIERKAELFARLRTAMRIAEPYTKGGLNDDGQDLPITTIKHNVERFCQDIVASGELLAIDGVRAMLRQIDKYRDKLFADPIRLQTPNGPRVIRPQRTNNILERFFRRLGHDVSKRTGQKLGEGFLTYLLPDTPLVANLDSPRYVEILLDGHESLNARLARVDQGQVDDTLAKARRERSGLHRAIRGWLRYRPAPLQIAHYILGQTG